MTDLLIGPDIALIMIGYLRPMLAARPESYAQGVHVGQGVALNPRHPRMVMVRDDSGPRVDVLRQKPRIGINVWSQTDGDAVDLARLVAALVWAAPDGKPLITTRHIAGPVEVADDSRQPRQYLTFELTVRVSEL